MAKKYTFSPTSCQVDGESPQKIYANYANGTIPGNKIEMKCEIDD